MSTSMSSKIDDLPGPRDEDSTIASEDQMYVKESPSNVKVDIKKRVRFEEESLMSKLKSEINEENLLVFLFLFIANSPQYNEYAASAPFMSTFSNSGFLVVGRALLLLIAFVIVKTFLLPRIKL
jgi:hypothetical protein